MKHDTQREVESALVDLQGMLPSLIEQCKQTQAILQAVCNQEEKPEQGKEKSLPPDYETEEIQRAAWLKAYIANPLSPLSVHLLCDLRKKVASELKVLKAEVNEAVESVREEYKKSSNSDVDSGKYLRGLQAQSVAMAKASIPHLLAMSDKLEIDLLELSGEELQCFVGIEGFQHVKGEANSILDILESNSTRLQTRSSSSLALRSTASLDLFLSGQAPSTLQNDHLLVDAAAGIARKNSPCKRSRWWARFGEAWNRLFGIRDSWCDLEKRIEEALKGSSTGSSLAVLKDLYDELTSSYLINSDAKEKLSTKMLDIVDSDRHTTRCRHCNEQVATVRCFPCQHVIFCMTCMHTILPSGEDVESLKTMGFVAFKEGEKPTVCSECEQEVKMATTK
uniref:Uncharacterized protein n=1 Tax=Palpitomonas bilix TaxID=652834 RepID=A0A7S3DBN7_9EUKA|mmetsp:Transcript_30069/g.77569  ORF Transcript_30069/g.77569 Transcript_30069/m.77569 type:complete len:394 (+) Transcript_30069:446-1627(+)